MKNSLLIALLGLTVSVVTPSIATADDFKFGPNKSYKNDHNRGHKHNNRHQQKHVTKHRNAHYDRKHDNKRRVAKVKPPKHPQLPHQRINRMLDQKQHNKHNRRYNNKHKHHNRQVNKHVRSHVKKHHYNKPKSSFSITFNSGSPGVIYDYGYNTARYYEPPQRYATSIYERQKRQQRRIQKGRESGQLVRREVKQLRQEQRHIQHKIAHYKRDGRLNRHERSRIHQMFDVASNNIRNKRNNGLTRWSKHRNYELAWH